MNSKCKLSVIVVTKNEEHNIAECLESVKWADEIVVVDAHSADSTVDVAKQFTSKVFVRNWNGYVETKEFALQNTTNEWVLWLDADERVTPELATEIQTVTKNTLTSVHGYKVGRRSYFLGKWIKHCGWYPGYVLRLFKKSKAKFVYSKVHEKVEVQGSVGALRNDILHYTDDTVFHYFAKFNLYTTLAAEDLVDAKQNVSTYDFLVRPIYTFFRMYILRFGLLDGMHGLILSLLSSYYVFVKYIKLLELNGKLGR